jgi:hypothetical protein
VDGYNEITIVDGDTEIVVGDINRMVLPLSIKPVKDRVSALYTYEVVDRYDVLDAAGNKIARFDSNHEAEEIVHIINTYDIVMKKLRNKL